MTIPGIDMLFMLFLYLPEHPVTETRPCDWRRLLLGLLRLFRFQVPCKPVERRIGRVALNAPRKPLRDFLQQPTIAVGILERNKGPITETLRGDKGTAGLLHFNHANARESVSIAVSMIGFATF
jgi:hypothetical protein